MKRTLRCWLGVSDHRITWVVGQAYTFPRCACGWSGEQDVLDRMAIIHRHRAAHGGVVKMPPLPDHVLNVLPPSAAPVAARRDMGDLGECDICDDPAVHVVVGEAGDFYFCKTHQRKTTS